MRRIWIAIKNFFYDLDMDLTLPPRYQGRDWERFK